MLAGRWDDGAADALRDEAPPNVTLTGWVEQDVLNEQMRRASVYVQASAHEGFGMSVAEAMLAGCIPVTTRAGALPEVVGDAGVAGRRRRTRSGWRRQSSRRSAWTRSAAAARQRVLEHFGLDVRRRGCTRS